VATGTSVGTKVFVSHGWRASAALSLGWMGFELLILLTRGPHEGRYTWIGWKRGLTPMRKASTPADPENIERHGGTSGLSAEALEEKE
jgi:hypothetical protein